jgi:hypothetical protein
MRAPTAAAWRSEYYPAGYHGSLTSTMLHALLFAHLYSVLAYPRGMYYGGAHYFGRPTTAFYHSSAYTSHYGAPMRGANGGMSYPRAAGAGGGMGGTGRVGTPVAQARPVAGGMGAAGRVGGAGGYNSGYGGRPGTPVAQGRPAGGYSSARSSYGGAHVSGGAHGRG